MDGTTKKAPFIFRYPFINGDDPSTNGEFPRLGTNICSFDTMADGGDIPVVEKSMTSIMDAS